MFGYGCTNSWFRFFGLGIVMEGALGTAVFLTFAFSGNSAVGQITPDSTLPSNSTVRLDGNTRIIEGGKQAGGNLFHSFGQFSVPTGSTAFFNNAQDIQNIISRVTGGSVSNIDGLIRAQGTANLFLINPSGIIFGENARLDIGGSFVGSTASSLKFADGFEFSATSPSSTPLLTISVPTGLQFGGNSGSILNQSLVTNSSNETVGLQVQRSKTLALVGGNVALEGGYLTAEKGRIELGSVGSPSLVSLAPTEQGWNLGYEGIQNLLDIQLYSRGVSDIEIFPGVFVSQPLASFISGDDIQVRGRQVKLTGNSRIEATNNLTVNASELVELSNSSLSSTFSYLSSNAATGGDLTITTGSLIVRDGASVSTFGSGTSRGNLSVNARDSVEVIGTNAVDPLVSPSRLSTLYGGDLKITTRKLIVQDGAEVSTVGLYGAGGGILTVAASDFVKVIGTDANEHPSRLFTYTSPPPPQIFQVKDGGNLTIVTRQLNVFDRAQVATSTSNTANGGNLTVRASDSVKLSGGGRISTQTEPGSTGSGGNLTVETERLEGTQLAVRSFGQGSAGKLTVTTPEPLPNLQSQIVPDRTLPSNSTVRSNFNTSIIEGGTQVGSNLFHSFTEFSLPTLSTAYFNNALDVQNIIARVTGSSVSKIDGQIQANGNANLFLLNPSGIIFSRDAFLNIGGSFVGSTAASLKFADGNQFSATAPQTTPRLTVSAPIGLQFSGTGGSILNQSSVSRFSPGFGLVVQPGKTLALVGGDVKLDRARLTAPGGRVELGGLAGSGMVELHLNGSNLSLSFPEEVARADVTITNQGAPNNNSAGVNVVGSDGGSIAINARNIDITGPYSRLSAGINGNSALPNPKAGDITLNATGMITISQLSFIENNQGGANGSPGNILMQAKGSIFVADSFISNILFGGVSTESRILPSGNKENSGNVSIQANGSVSIKNSSILNSISFGYGNIGNVSVQASDSVSLANSSISTTTFGQGNSGDITVQTNALRLLAQAELNATTRGEGNGGNITVNVNTLEITGGGQIVTAAFKDGNAGNITVNAKDSITLSGSDPNRLFYLEFDPNTNSFIPSQLIRDEDELNGFGIIGFNSGIFANTTKRSSGQGGSIRIETGSLNVQDGAEVTVSSAGAGDAGELRVNANSIYLDKGKLVGTTASGRGGDIKLQAQDLILMRNGSTIATTAANNGSGGNITIDSPFIVAVPKENNDIVANAETGLGGKITINATRIYGLEYSDRLTPKSDINASSNVAGLDGVVEVNTPYVDPSQELVEFPINLLEASQLIDTTCNPNGSQQASSFTITGRGGLASSPYEMLIADAVMVNWITLNPENNNRSTPTVTSKPTTATPQPIVEATGWVKNDKGEVVLTATPSTASPHSPWQNPGSCRAS